MSWWSRANGWKRAAAITSTLVAVGVIVTSTIGFALTAATEMGPVASDADIERLELQVDSVNDTATTAVSRADSLRRDVQAIRETNRAILWVVCHEFEGSPDHQQCAKVRDDGS